MTEPKLQDTPKTPYEVVLEKCDGDKKKLAEILEIDDSGVRKLPMPKDKGGMGGEFRDTHIIRLLKNGPRYGVHFELSDLGIVPEAEPEQGDAA